MSLKTSCKMIFPLKKSFDLHHTWLSVAKFRVYINIPFLEAFNMSDKQIMTAKNVLRKKLISVINNLPKNEIIRQSKIVTDKVIQNAEFQKAKIVSIYLSMENEIQTEDLVRHIFKHEKECFIPRSAIIVDDLKFSDWIADDVHTSTIRFQTGSPIMEMIRLSSMEQYATLPRNKWNIKQPSDDEKIESVFDRGQLDLVLAPGLGFTLEGLRLGRGKGYYDRFFAKCKQELPNFPYIIGLAFNEQILPEIPTDETDFPLNLIVSPQ